MTSLQAGFSGRSCARAGPTLSCARRPLTLTGGRCRPQWSHGGPRALRCSNTEGGAGSAEDAGSESAGSEQYRQLHPDEVPEELRDLRLTEDGILVDEKTGKAINEMGATRFDVAVRAMRGELDPPAWQENCERSPGIILQSLVQFPTDYMFQVVGQPGKRDGCSREQFIEDMAGVVRAACQEELPSSCIEAVDRMGGKYVSLRMTCRVRAPEVIAKVFEMLEGDERVRMKF